MAGAQPWLALDGYPVALVWLDDDGCIVQANAAWQRLMNIATGAGALIEWVHQEDRRLWADALQRLRGQPGEAFCQRLRFVHRSGDLYWLEICLSRGDAGYYLTAHDVTAHKRREIALQASHRSAATLLDSLPGMVYRGRNNRDWSMEFVSAGCLALTGYPAERLTDSLDLSYGRLIHEADCDYVWREVQYALARRHAYELRYRIRCADGTLKQVWEKGVGIYADTGEVLGIEGAIYESGMDWPQR